MSPDQKYYAATYKVSAEEMTIIGLGLTPEGAMADAAEWFADTDKLAIYEIPESCYLDAKTKIPAVRDSYMAIRRRMEGGQS